jgi:hypothetical protein
MKRLPIASIPFALALAGLTVAASAQTQPPPAPANPPTQASPPAPHAAPTPEHVDDRIESMRRRLQITPQQEPAWDTFAQAMRDNATTAAQAYRDRAAHLQTMTAVENLRSFAQLEQTRAQGLQGLATSFETLYGQLSDEQKHTADAMFRHQGRRTPHHKGQSHHS